MQSTSTGGFDAIVIGWKGQDWNIPADRVMGLLAAIEEIVQPHQGGGTSAIDLLSQPHKMHLTKLARAYAAALRYAGCPVTDDQVYLSLSRDVQQGGVEGFQAMQTLSTALLEMFFPDWARNDLGNLQRVGDQEADPTQPSPSSAGSSEPSTN